MMNPDGVLLDTAFLIKLQDENDPKNASAVQYFKYFLDKKFRLYLSSIAIAEYCVKGDFNDLPLNECRILVFGAAHAQVAGKLRAIYSPVRTEEDGTRNVVINDIKMFAQADVSENIGYFVTFDQKSRKPYDKIDSQRKLKFKHIDANVPLSERTGELF